MRERLEQILKVDLEIVNHKNHLKSAKTQEAIDHWKKYIKILQLKRRRLNVERKQSL